MDISKTQSGQSNYALAPTHKAKPDNVSTDQKTTSASTVKEANPPHQSAKFSASLLSNSTQSVLLQEQETSPVGLQDIANKYDVTNLSGNERLALAQELHNNGFISSGVHLALAAPLSMNENLSERTNYLEMTRQAVEFASTHGASTEQLALQRDQLSLLERLSAHAI